MTASANLLGSNAEFCKRLYCLANSSQLISIV